MKKKALIIVNGGIPSVFAEDGVDVVCVDLDDSKVMVESDMVPIHNSYGSLMELAEVVGAWPMSDDGRMDDADHLEISSQQHDPHHHDRNFPSPIRIVVEVECGLVQTVYSESFTDVRVAVKDMDVSGADGDEIAELDDGTEFVGRIESAYRNDMLVKRVFAAFGEESITIDRQQENYVARKGQCCPNCGSADIAGEPIEADGDEGISETHCFNCKSTWKDQFRLVGFTGLEATPLKVIKSVSGRGYLSSADGWVFDVASDIK